MGGQGMAIKFKVLSRENVEKYDVKEKHIVISYRDLGNEKANLPENKNRLDVLWLCFDDLTGKEDGAEKPFNEEAAKQIWDFIRKHLNSIEYIVLNCEAGISRSPATAAAIAQVLNGNNEYFFKNPMFILNVFIYKLMLREGLKKTT
jgi:predicted protein tyrosine phosphatase